jgi:UDP-N-acetylmuramoyl-L-alanyl-D-glutamate--2,6-diaminopimelate ligase
MRAGRDRGATHAAAEYTSEALARGFAQAWPCRIAVFTNLTRDHLDAHGSAEHYLASKAQLFLHLQSGGVAVLNASDPAGELLAQIVPAHARVVTYSCALRGAAWARAQVTAVDIVPSFEGTSMRLVWENSVAGLPRQLKIPAIGAIFAENALAALLAAIETGVSAADAARALESCAPPAGRFEIVSKRPWIVVDYAHTPDALSRTLATARTLATRSGGRVAVVFGAGGGRDTGKRAQMGEAATAADCIVLTTDNPRNEDPRAITDAIRAGIASRPEVFIELDRSRAITRAVREAGSDDVVVIAGKGHEQEQVVGAERRAFSDVEMAKWAVEKRG